MHDQTMNILMVLLDIVGIMDGAYVDIVLYIKQSLYRVNIVTSQDVFVNNIHHCRHF